MNSVCIIIARGVSSNMIILPICSIFETDIAHNISLHISYTFLVEVEAVLCLSLKLVHS